MTHVMFDQYEFDNGFHFDADYNEVDKYLIDLMYPTPNPTLLPEFDPYKIEPRPCSYCSLSNFFIFISVLQFGMFFGFFVTSLIYNYMFDWNVDKDDVDVDVEEIPYHKKYKLRRMRNTDEESEHDSDDTIPSENTFVQELTPDGMVFMSYNNADEGFIYWADGNIRFTYLETVARKFVNCFGCSQLYIQRECDESDSDVESDTETIADSDAESGVEADETPEEEDTPQEEETPEEKETPEAETPEKKSGPFAQLKKYNLRSTAKTDENGETNTQTATTNNSCKFIKRGKLCDFKVTQDIEIVEPKQKLTFASFKSMFMSEPTY